VSHAILDRIDAERATGVDATAELVVVVFFDERRVTGHALDTEVFDVCGGERVADEGLGCVVSEPTRRVERRHYLIHLLFGAQFATHSCIWVWAAGRMS
jgi:hypothetical protein